MLFKKNSLFLSVSNLRRGVDIPKANGVVVTGAEQVAVQVGVPGETVALLLTKKLQIQLLENHNSS